MIKVIFTIFLLFTTTTYAGPVAYGICQTGCNALAVACYAAAGTTFGAVTFGAGTPLAVIACAGAQGTCMAACVAAGFAPTP